MLIHRLFYYSGYQMNDEQTMVFKYHQTITSKLLIILEPLMVFNLFLNLGFSATEVLKNGIFLSISAVLITIKLIMFFLINPRLRLFVSPQKIVFKHFFPIKSWSLDLQDIDKVSINQVKPSIWRYLFIPLTIYLTDKSKKERMFELRQWQYQNTPPPKDMKQHPLLLVLEKIFEIVPYKNPVLSSKDNEFNRDLGPIAEKTIFAVIILLFASFVIFTMNIRWASLDDYKHYYAIILSLISLFLIIRWAKNHPIVQDLFAKEPTNTIKTSVISSIILFFSFWVFYFALLCFEVRTLGADMDVIYTLKAQTKQQQTWSSHSGTPHIHYKTNKPIYTKIGDQQSFSLRYNMGMYMIAEKEFEKVIGYKLRR